MIIVPNNHAKKTYKPTANTLQISTLSNYLAQQLSFTSFETASKAIINHMLEQWIEPQHLASVKQHIRYIYQHDLCTQQLLKEDYPNTQWIVNILLKLEKELLQHQLIHPDATAKTLMAHSTPPQNPPQLFGCSEIKPSITRLFRNWKATTLPADSASGRKQTLLAKYEQVTDEVVAALKWHTQTPNSAIVVLNPRYRQAINFHMLNYCSIISNIANDDPLIRTIIHITKPNPSLPREVISYLMQAKSYPEGMSPLQLINKEYYQSAPIPLTFSYLHTPLMISSTSIPVDQFITIILEITQFWRLGKTGIIQKKLEAALCNLNTLSLLNLAQPYQKWHIALSNLLADSQDPPSHLTILSPEEACGSQFDGLWFIGAEHSSWKQRPKLYALPPAYISTKDWLFLAEASPITILSLQTTSETGELQHIPATLNPEPYPRCTLQPSKNNISPIQTIEDWTLTHDSPLQGGVSLIQDYQACPFKAFAKHRLKLRKKSPITHDIAPNHYGTITHDVLEQIYQEIQHQDELHQIESSHIQTQLDLIWSRHKASKSLHPNLVTILKSRMLETIQEWIQTDQSRPPFTVHALETKALLPLGEHTITVRIDRIDHVNQQPVLIDYKTGRANIVDTFLPSFEHPQMALYSLTQEQPSSIAYAKLLPKAALWQPVDLSCDKTLNKHLSARGHELMSLQSLKDLWTQKAYSSLSQYTQGMFQAAPASPKTCDQCDFMSLCRIYDQGEH